MDLIPFLFFVALFFNIRASIKLALDWRGMLITTRFVREAYARRADLPAEERLEREPGAPVFLHLVPAYQEPDIAVTVGALTASRYPHGRLHVVVITKDEEERDPHPAMRVSTGELVRRLRETLPPYQQKRLSHVVMAGPGRKAHQLNWALRPEVLREILTEETDPRRVFVGVSDADSIPDPDTYRWMAQRELGGQGNLAYQGIPLSLANYDRLGIRGKICAIQQSSIFIRVSIARLLNEVKRVRLLARLVPGLPPRGPPLLVLHGHRRAHRLAAADGVGGRHHDPGPDRGSPPVPAAPRGPAPEKPEGEVPRHLPLPDLLAARDARGLAGALGPGPHRALRAGQDRSRHRPSCPHALRCIDPLPSGERAG